MIYFLYDSDGYYLGNSNIKAENSTEIEPTLKDGYWSKFNGKKWTTEKIAESAVDLDGVTIPDIACDGVTASNHDKELYSLFERYLDNSSYIVKDAENKTLTFKVLTDEDLLKKAKIKKLEELASKTKTLSSDDCKEMYVTSSLGVVIDADGTARNNLLGLITTYTNPVTFRLRDNTYLQDVTLEQLETMQKECYLNGQNLYAQKWQFEQQIEACTTKEEIEAVSLDFVMMDFSGKAGA